MKKMTRYRSAGALGCHTRIRAGFPRERWGARTLARDRPSPYGEGAAFFHRSAEALGCHTRIRAGFPPRALLCLMRL